MKKNLLFILGLLIASSLSAQVVFMGVYPESIQGNYELNYADASLEWAAIPDLTDPANAVQDTLVLGKLQDGCTELTNPEEIAGHIAVLYRGDCEFGLKAKNAELAGAVAVILINNESGTVTNFGMLAGDNGASVEIPVVMITDQDGATLVSAMEEGPVVVFIGNKIGHLDYDLGLKINNILRPEFSSYPSVLANAASTPYTINVGGSVYNYGTQTQDDIALRAIISYNGNEIYNEVSGHHEIAMGDSAIVSLPPYSPDTWESGYYNFVYIAESDTLDEYAPDNTIESDFMISDEGYFSYSKMDPATMLPNYSGGSRVIDGASGEPIPNYSSCIHYRDANSNLLYADKLYFQAMKGSSASDTSMIGESLTMYIYEYNDNFNTVEDAGFQNPIGNLNPVAIQEILIEEETRVVNVEAQFASENQVILQDNQRYLFCVNTQNQEVYLGTDSKRDYEMNFEFYLQPLFPIEAGNDGINPVGFGPSTVPAIAVKMEDVNYLGLADEINSISMNAYPSPANTTLNINFKGNDVKNVELISLTGQVVSSQAINSNETSTSFDVEGLENGVYLVNVTLTNNITHTMKVVINH